MQNYFSKLINIVFDFITALLILFLSFCFIVLLDNKWKQIFKNDLWAGIELLIGFFIFLNGYDFFKE